MHDNTRASVISRKLVEVSTLTSCVLDMTRWWGIKRTADPATAGNFALVVKEDDVKIKNIENDVTTIIS